MISVDFVKSMKTNTSYLLEIINIQKGKNLAAYFNDIPINYALNRLVKDNKFSSYKKMPLISDEWDIIMSNNFL